MPATPPSPKKLHWDIHNRMGLSFAVALVGAGVLAMTTEWQVALVGSWCIFAATLLLVDLRAMVTRDPYQARRNARLNDTSRTVLFCSVVAGATISLLAVVLLLGNTKDLPAWKEDVRIALVIVAILLSWTLIHVLFAFRYAHVYYHNAHSVEIDKVAGGLDFPGDEAPDYADFSYFSFVIGMTCQVSDVQITSRRIRRLALLHGLLSFIFNTAIVAMLVNLIAGLI